MWKFYALESLIQVLWSVTPSASRHVLAFWPVEAYIALRFTLSGSLFLIVALFTRPRVRIARRDLPPLAVLGILTYGVASLGTLYGLKLGGVVTFALASGCNAVITALASVYVLRERWGKGLLAAIALSVVGSVCLAWGKYQLASRGVALGSLLLVWFAYASEATGFVFSKRFTGRYPLPWYLAILQLSAGLFLGLVAFLSHPQLPALASLPLSCWAALTYVVIFSCGICYAVHYWLLRYLPGHRLAFFDSIHAASAATFGVLLFGDPLNGWMMAGGFLLLASVWAVNAGQHAS